jgi:hypothetical protein
MAEYVFIRTAEGTVCEKFVLVSGDNPERNYEISELLIFYQEATARLTPLTHAVHFFEMQEFSCEATAQVLEMSVKAVSRRRERAWESIREYVAKKVHQTKEISPDRVDAGRGSVVGRSRMKMA